jgi:ABC-type transporter Mla maintaining outer membrane lipid asymmetry ATPase subunit MlaF
MGQPMIQSLRFENLTFGYDDQHPLFNSLDFDFPMNRTVWLNAESGQGRSSLLQLLGVLRLPQSGRFVINEMNIGEISFEEFLPYRLKIGYGFDFGGLLNNRTVLENMTLPLLYHKLLEPKAAKTRAIEYLEYMGIGKYQDQRPAVVPGGVRKISCMIRALIHHPELLLLDDPSVGMNEATVLKYFDLVRKVKDQGSLQHVFISSFDKKLMGLLSATEVVIDDGKLYLNEPTEKYAVNT